MDYTLRELIDRFLYLLEYITPIVRVQSHRSYNAEKAKREHMIDQREAHRRLVESHKPFRRFLREVFDENYKFRKLSKNLSWRTKVEGTDMNLYEYAKESWRNDPELIQYHFPFIAISKHEPLQWNPAYDLDGVENWGIPTIKFLIRAGVIVKK